MAVKFFTPVLVRFRRERPLHCGSDRLYHAQNYLEDFYRKMKWGLGTPVAVTATAHKPSIVYHMLSTKQAYSVEVFSPNAVPARYEHEQ